MTYDVSAVLPVDEVDAGTSLLIAGPPLTAKRELMLRLLGSDEPDSGSIMVTTKAGAGRLMESYRAENPDRTAETLRIIDCVSKTRGIGQVRETETTRYLSSPQDMTGLSIELSGAFQELYQRDIDTRVGVHSLSTFLMYGNLRRVYRLVHILSGKIESAGWFGAFVIDSPTAQERDVLSQLVDGLIETRETDDGREFKLRGLGGRKAGWQSY